ncbi:GntR family transcriptional regulator [Amycolatopsis jejuensis]|uniref:GntR family transcriptional regulator n=1 Tax=Amycolatopsis jejuensis TaxID=330084 RepID=UPI0005271DC3|nr:GntR family transcriptional regulator [Amycolatopsis jejuensis]
MARYRAIAADLAAKIRAGEYAPGEALPPQRELSAAYGVTLMTLRQALRELSDEALIVQQPGRGTFVTPTYRLGSLRSFTEDLRDQGYVVRTEVVSQTVRRLPARIAAQLQARSTDSGLRLERVREFGGRRAIHQVSWIAPPHGERLRDNDFTAVSLYTALAELDVTVGCASETIRPDVLDDKLARHLGEPAGTPVLVSERSTSTSDGTVVVTDRATILGSMMHITTERATDHLSLRWGTGT